MKEFFRLLKVGFDNRTKYFWQMIVIMSVGFMVDLIMVFTVSQSIIVIFIETYFALNLIALMIAWVWQTGEMFDKYIKNKSKI